MNSEELFVQWWNSPGHTLDMNSNESHARYSARCAWHARDRYIASLESRIDSLTAQVASLSQDAARYRYLREHSCRYDSNGHNAESWSTHDDPESLDAIIDSQLKENDDVP